MLANSSRLGDLRVLEGAKVENIRFDPNGRHAYLEMIVLEDRGLAPMEEHAVILTLTNSRGGLGWEVGRLCACGFKQLSERSKA